MTLVKECKVRHYVEDFTIDVDKRKWWVKCSNRMCYERNLKDSDYCLCHHQRDECPDEKVERCYV